MRTLLMLPLVAVSDAPHQKPRTKHQAATQTAAAPHRRRQHAAGRPAATAAPPTSTAATAAVHSMAAAQTSPSNLPVHVACASTSPSTGSDISSADATALQRAARCLKADRALHVSIEGNADERGTEEYNMALGDRRAHAVAEYLESLGACEQQLQTVSYGKENPLCTEHDEACWAQNRRAELMAQNSGQADEEGPPQVKPWRLALGVGRGAGRALLLVGLRRGRAAAILHRRIRRGSVAAGAARRASSSASPTRSACATPSSTSACRTPPTAACGARGDAACSTAPPSPTSRTTARRCCSPTSTSPSGRR